MVIRSCVEPSLAVVWSLGRVSAEEQLIHSKSDEQENGYNQETAGVIPARGVGTVVLLILVVVLVTGETIEEIGGKSSKISESIRSSLGSPAALVLPPTLLCQLQAVL